MTHRRNYRCALITGASSGLGEELAIQLAHRVSHLVLVARREPLLRDLAERIRAAYPETAVSVFAMDLTSPEERKRLVEMLAADGLAPDLLVNNAGMGDYGEFSTAEWSKLEATLRINIEALTHLTHLLVPGMIHGNGGAVMNISSLASILPIPDFAVYAATKAYVTSFSEALRIELRDHGIRVIAVCPGPVHTEFGNVARRGESGPGMPAREFFYEPKETVVYDALDALDRDRARVYPGLKIALAACVISALPLFLLRAALSNRPRRNG